ncbi:hypothetical protein Mapa_009628 [Marchantia paleacea]|nr:hypothetical protein Mapa_009628 [Marchantia paleacea]
MGIADILGGRRQQWFGCDMYRSTSAAYSILFRPSPIDHRFVVFGFRSVAFVRSNIDGARLVRLEDSAATGLGSRPTVTHAGSAIVVSTGIKGNHSSHQRRSALLRWPISEDAAFVFYCS